MIQFPLPTSLPETVKAYEGRIIEEALGRANGSIVEAAKLLGVSHQGTRLHFEYQACGVEVGAQAPRRSRPIF